MATMLLWWRYVHSKSEFVIYDVHVTALCVCGFANLYRLHFQLCVLGTRRVPGNCSVPLEKIQCRPKYDGISTDACFHMCLYACDCSSSNPTTQAKDGSFALALTSFEGHVEVMRLLLQNGAQVDKALPDGSTALMIAIQVRVWMHLTRQ